MHHVITEEDKMLILQNNIRYNYRMFIVDDQMNVLQRLNEIDISSYTIDATSSVRRTISASIYQIDDIDEFLHLYMRMNFKLEIGVYSLIKDQYIYYPCGTYVITEGSTSYDATNNVMTCTFADWFAKLDGTRSGQVGGNAKIVLEKETEDTHIKRTLQNAMKYVLELQQIPTDSIIEDFGEFYGIESMNPNGYVEYRKNNPEWNILPYDLEFSSTATQGDIIEEITNLYPNIESYFDIYNYFCTNMIPSCYNDQIILDNDFLQDILVGENSEGTTYNITDIKNVTEVFGNEYEPDRTSENTVFTNSSLLTINLEKFTEYVGYEMIAFTPPSTNNSENTYVRVNSLGQIPLYQEYTSSWVKPSTLVANETNVIKIVKPANSSTYVAYYLGQYQPHALCVLTNNINDPKYTKKFFSERYNVDEKNIILREEDSPYCVQKLGIVLDVKEGEEYENILSDAVAQQNAIYQNTISSSMNDTVEIVTKLVPWIYENSKVEYKRQNGTSIEQYIVKNITHDLAGMTSSITLQKFYPLYYV